jgi:tRNA pseudouridine38-40 synthase
MKCVVGYDGKNYNGWQIQDNQPSVQGAIEASLKKIHNGEDIKIYGASRTDSGVHANGQVFHFDSEIPLAGDRWRLAINTYMDNDIFVKSVEHVDEAFHARFDVVKKEYRYKLSYNQFDPIKRQYVEFEFRQLDVELMKKELECLIGSHDFSSFTSRSEYDSYVREIFEAEIIEDNGELTFRFVGSGFMRYMIRIIVGTLVEIGYGRKENLAFIRDQKKRIYAGKCASPHGLYLEKIWYK